MRGLPPSLLRAFTVCLSWRISVPRRERSGERVLDSRKISGCECVACQQPVNASPPPFRLIILERQVNMTSPLHWTARGLQALRFCFRHGHFRILYYCCSLLLLWPRSAERPLFFRATQSIRKCTHGPSRSLPFCSLGVRLVSR